MNPETPLPPMFSAFERRYDPALAAEDDNPLYEAFRRRRKTHGAVGAAALLSLRTMRLRGGAAPAVIGMGIVGVAFIPMLFGGRSLAPVVFITVAVVVIMRAVQARGSSSGSDAVRLPARLLSVFAQPVGRGTRGEIDLWMTGASGTTVAEAMYLEMREHALATTVVIMQVIALCVVGMYWKAVGEFRFGGVLLSVSAPWFAWRVGLLFHAGGAATAWTRIGAMATRWQTTAVPPTLRATFDDIVDDFSTLAAVLRHRRARIGLLRALGKFVARPLLLVVLAVVAVCIVALLVKHSAWIGATFVGAAFDVLLVAWRFVGWEMFVAALLLAMSVPAGAAALKESTRISRIRERAMRNLERSYQLYMAKALVKDPDALAWVDMAWPEDRSAKLSGVLRGLLAKADAGEGEGLGVEPAS
jgi:hypothetical protein